MAKLKNPFLSLSASNTISRAITFVRRRSQNIAEKKPVPEDVKSPAQLSWRHMYQKCIDLWHALSAEEKQEWESLARSRHMTGFAWFQSQCLRPNPGIYLPLQGGTMQGNIDMAKYRILKLPAPVAGQEPVTRAYYWANLPPGGYTEGARVYHDAAQSIPQATTTTLAFNSERYDTDTIHDPVTNNSRLTCKTAGKYVIILHFRWAGSVGSWCFAQIRLNATTIIVYTSRDAQSVAWDTSLFSTIYDLGVDDYVEAQVYHSNGGALNVASLAQYSPEFMMQRIGT